MQAVQEHVHTKLATVAVTVVQVTYMVLPKVPTLCVRQEVNQEIHNLDLQVHSVHTHAVGAEYRQETIHQLLQEQTVTIL